jgi:hypothetical protein
LPGIPIVVLGHNDHIAWGFTNTAPDVQDLFIERVNPANPSEFQTPDGWAEFKTMTETIKVKGNPDVALLVMESRHGPIISGALPVFANNYRQLFTVVVPRMQIQLPDLTTSQGTPEPWLVVLPFANLFVLLGVTDVLWELRIHSSSSTDYYHLDGWKGDEYSSGTSQELGAGCLATGAPATMTLSVDSSAHRTNRTFLLSARGMWSAPHAPTAIWFGASTSSERKPSNFGNDGESIPRMSMREKMMSE